MVASDNSNEEAGVNQPGVYLRGSIWWYSLGRGIRRSSNSIDKNVAIAMRERALQFKREGVAARAAIRLEVNAPIVWAEWLATQQGDRDSWLHRTHRHMRRKTRLRHWVDCLSLDELCALTLNSSGRCALTGLPFHTDRGVTRHPFAISIDRMDSSKGYTLGNVRLVLLAVNLAMSHWGDEAFRSIARALVGRELLSGCTKP